MKKTFWIAAAAVLASLPMAASALPVFVSQSQVLSFDGQDLNFAFGGLVAGDGSGGTITIATGPGSGIDLSGAFDGEDENFEALFDGASQGSFSCGGSSNNGSTAIPGATDGGFNFNDCIFSLSFNLNGAALAALLADGNLLIDILFGDDVSSFGQEDQLIVSLSYNSVAAAVPEPAILALFGLGAAGLAVLRRRA